MIALLGNKIIYSWGVTGSVARCFTKNMKSVGLFAIDILYILDFF